MYRRPHSFGQYTGSGSLAPTTIKQIYKWYYVKIYIGSIHRIHNLRVKSTTNVTTQEKSEKSINTYCFGHNLMLLKYILKYDVVSCVGLKEVLTMVLLPNHKINFITRATIKAAVFCTHR